MRKWMRERLQRRKKKDTDSSAQPAPPPLQPAYFDAGESAAEPEPKAVEPKARISRAAQVEAEPAQEERSAEAAPEPSEIPSANRASPAGQRGRPRRRRGGRGRSGRGREQGVAQAFSPAAIKGSIPSEPVQEAADTVESMGEEVISGDSTRTNVSRPQIPQAPKVPAAISATQRPPKGLVVLAIGLPGSGTSSWFK